MTIDINMVNETTANMNEVTKRLCQYLAHRQRDRQTLNIKKVAKELNAGSEVSEFFKRLARAGVGELMLNRAGRPAEFTWHYSLRDFGRFALGEDIRVRPFKTKHRLSVAKGKVLLARHTVADRDKEIRIIIPKEVIGFIKQLTKDRGFGKA